MIGVPSELVRQRLLVTAHLGVQICVSQDLKILRVHRGGEGTAPPTSWGGSLATNPH